MITRLENELQYRSQLEYSRYCIRLIMETSSRPIVSSKFGADATVFLHLITQELPDIPVIWVDSGLNTPATLNFVEETKSDLSLNLNVYQPMPISVSTVADEKSSDANDLVSRMKIEPFKRAFNDHQPDVWFSSLRRYQTEHRASKTVYEQATPTLVKAYPILEWSQEFVERYKEENNLASGPQAFDTTKLSSHAECGLHTYKW